MATFFFIIATWLLIVTFGIKVRRSDKVEFDQPAILDKKIMKAFPCICAFILPVIPLYLLTGINWFVIFVLNTVFVLVAGHFLTKAYLIRFSSGKGLGHNQVEVCRNGIIALAIGLIIQYWPLLSGTIKTLYQNR